MADLLTRLIDQVLPEVIALRRELHAHPEPSRQEHETCRRIRERLVKLPGFKVLPPLGETDVVALLNPDRKGPCLALRADMDALPIQEDADVSELSYRSQVPGMMHACGHDGHVANLVGTAMVLSQMADKLPGRVLFVFSAGRRGPGRRECALPAGSVRCDQDRRDHRVARLAAAPRRVRLVALWASHGFE